MIDDVVVGGVAVTGACNSRKKEDDANASRAMIINNYN